MKHKQMLNVLWKRIYANIYSDNYRLAALIIDKKKSVYIGINKNKTHPLMLRFQKHPEAINIHAEIDAIRLAIKRIGEEGLSSSTLYVARIKFSDPDAKKDIWGLAKPCAGCMMAIEAFNIKKVIYSLDGEELLYEELQRDE